MVTGPQSIQQRDLESPEGRIPLVSRAVSLSKRSKAPAANFPCPGLETRPLPPLCPLHINTGTCPVTPLNTKFQIRLAWVPSPPKGSASGPCHSPICLNSRHGPPLSSGHGIFTSVALPLVLHLSVPGGGPSFLQRRIPSPAPQWVQTEGPDHLKAKCPLSKFPHSSVIFFASPTPPSAHLSRFTSHTWQPPGSFSTHHLARVASPRVPGGNVSFRAFLLPLVCYWSPKLSPAFSH